SARRRGFECSSPDGGGRSAGRPPLRSRQSSGDLGYRRRRGPRRRPLPRQCRPRTVRRRPRAGLPPRHAGRADVAGRLSTLAGVSGSAGIVASIVGYILIPVWVFYLIKDRPALTAAAERSMPVAWWRDIRAISDLVLRVFGQWLRGQLFLGLTVGLATFAGL